MLVTGHHAASPRPCNGALLAVARYLGAESLITNAEDLCVGSSISTCPHPAQPSLAWLVNSHHLCLQRSYSSITHMTGKQDLDKFPSFSDSLIGIWNFSPGSVEIYDTGTAQHTGHSSVSNLRQTLSSAICV